MNTLRKYVKVELLFYLFGVVDAVYFLKQSESLAYSLTPYQIMRMIRDIVAGEFLAEHLIGTLGNLLIMSLGFSAYGFLRKRHWVFSLYYCQLPLHLFLMIGTISRLYDIYTLYNAQVIYLIGVCIVLALVIARFILTVVLHTKCSVSIGVEPDSRKNFPRLEKLLLRLFMIAVTIAAIHFCYRLIPREYEYVRHPVRPDDFPEILITPENAYNLDHSTTSNSRIVKHTWGLSFVVDEPYPSDNVREFFDNHLSANGWQKLEYDLLNPNILMCARPFLPGAKNILTDESEDEWPVFCIAYWINEEEEYISVLFTYATHPDVKPNLNRLMVHMSLFGTKSWGNLHVKQYTQLHPEEFRQLKGATNQGAD